MKPARGLRQLRVAVAVMILVMVASVGFPPLIALKNKRPAGMAAP